MVILYRAAIELLKYNISEPGAGPTKCPGAHNPLHVDFLIIFEANE